MNTLPGHFPGGAMATDQGGGGNDQFTKLLLHCNGTDTSTSFPDSSPVPKTVTANGNAQVDTAQSVFGGASALMDGTGDFLSIPDSDDWFLGDGDFAFDARVRFNATPNPMMLFSQDQDANNYQRCYIETSGTNFVFHGVVATVPRCAFSAPISVTTGQFYHIAFTRDGSNFRVFIDGIQRGPTFVNSEFLPNYTGNLTLGIQVASFGLNGWMDEIRWSKGTPRWRSNFAVPGQAYF